MKIKESKKDYFDFPNKMFYNIYMYLILTFCVLCTSLWGQQVTSVVSNSPNSPYRQLSFLTTEVDTLKGKIDSINVINEKLEVLFEELKSLKATGFASQGTVCLGTDGNSVKALQEEIKQLKESMEVFTKNNADFQNQLKNFHLSYEALSKKILTLEEENKLLKKFLNTDNSNINIDVLRAEYANLEQKFEDACRFISDISNEKQELMQKEIQSSRNLSTQIEQKVLAILEDWCKQAEGKIEAEHASLEEVKRTLPKGDEWMSSKAFVAFKDENEQHIKELIDCFAEEKIAQFAQKLDEQDQKIYQLSKETGGDNNLKHSFLKIEKKLGEFCKTTCDETIRQVNDRLQNLAQQMQSGFDALSCTQCIKHTINSGESLSSIARRYHITPAQIRAINGLQNSKNLRVGDTILIPKNP